MFEKIWYPDENLYIISKFGLFIALGPLMLLNFFVSIAVDIAIAFLVVLFFAIIRIRGAITLTLNADDLASMTKIRINRNKMALYFFLVVCTLVILVVVLGALLSEELYVVLPMTLAFLFMVMMSVMAFGLRCSLVALFVLTITTYVVTFILADKVAVIFTMILVAIGGPEVIVGGIKTDRLHKGNLARKLPPYRAQNEDQQQV